MSCRVHTAVRIRPPSSSERTSNKQEMIFINPETKGIEVLASTVTMKVPPNKRYNFDNSFDSGATQGDVYGAVGLPLVHCVMQGINASLFAYGMVSSLA
jgi:hypothetical protein